MALSDFETFIRERFIKWDDTVDTAAGSTFDTQVVQPILRRLGTDPFTVDAATFIVERITQAFPESAISDGDGASDLLVKPWLLIFDPIIREIQRVKRMLSTKDPASLTIEEAEALGANLFKARKTGDFAKGPVRIYFSTPQNRKVTPANFVTSSTGLHYFPDRNQSISAESMLLNREGDLYFFDVNVTAEAVGSSYNLEPGEIATIANIDTAIRVTNKARFRDGEDAEDAETYIGNLDKSLSERSLVTLRGIASSVGNNFSEITRLAVVGFNDPEMKRDIIKGGSLGRTIAYGFDGTVVGDGEYKSRTRRFYSAGANFTSTVGPIGLVDGFVLTVFDAFGPAAAEKVQDLVITRVIDANTVEVAEQVFFPAAGAKSYTVRKRELTLSGIPGGILVPDSPNGTVAITPDEVHIGGMTDVHVRGSELDTSSVTIDTVVDDEPLEDGVLASVIDDGFGVYVFTLQDIVLGTDYQVDDPTWVAFEHAREYQYTLHILDGVVAGAYRIRDVVQSPGASPIVYVLPVPLAVSPSLEFRWKLVDEISIDLVEPKDTRLSGSDGSCLQNSDIFQTLTPVDFDALGVSIGDILRINNGLNADDYVVEEVVAPGFTTLRTNKDFIASTAGTSFSIFRNNEGGGVLRPLVRITKVSLLDTSGQPVGAAIPYAKPVDAVTTAFSNAGVGVKVSVADAFLGIVSVAQGGGFVFGGGGTISFTWDGLVTPLSVTLTGTLTAAQVVTAINLASTGNPAIGVPLAVAITYGSSNYVGIIPIGKNTRLATPYTAGVLIVLFGDTQTRACGDIRSTSVIWGNVTPTIDVDLDAVQVFDGVAYGTHDDLEVNPTLTGFATSDALRVSTDFSPEVFRSVAVGSRSLGSVRLYFLEPTSMEVDQATRFSVTNSSEVELFYKPDPTLSRQVLPALPNGEKAKDGANSAASPTFTSAGTDFSTKSIREGDYLVIDYVPITGSVNLADPVLSLALKHLTVSYNNSPDKFITFINDVGTPNAVSRDGVAEQINVAVGEDICEVVEVAPGDFRLQFNPDAIVKVRQQSSSPSTSANVALGFSNSVDTTNVALNAGEYLITGVATPTVNNVTVSPNLTDAATSQQYKVVRKGSQRIVSTEMSSNTADGSLYFWDVELVSEGPGDTWNIPSDLQMRVKNYRSDGYYLTTEDSNTSFSASESLKMHLSKSILEVGVDDDPDNSTQLSGQSISIEYEYASSVGSLQSFMVSDTERVINQNPLSRFLTPHFVRFNMTYKGGVTEETLDPLLRKHIKEGIPDQPLYSSSIQRKASDKGAISITNPIDLLAIVHYFDRDIYITRSKDALTTGRLAAFIPDVLNLKRVIG
jgi:hypothetical protein